jgi:hypothetical protein
VAKELSLKGTPDPVSSIVRHTNDVLKFGREGVVDPGEHHLVIRSQSSDGSGTAERTWSARAYRRRVCRT